MNKDSMSVETVEKELLKAIENMSRRELEEVLRNLISKMFSIGAINTATTVAATKAVEGNDVMPMKNEAKVSDERITSFLLNLGIPMHLKGSAYLRTAIKYYSENKGCAITKELYPHIARMHKTTSSRVERAIRHAIEIGYGRGDLQTYERFFGYSTNPKKGKATNCEFIATLVEQLQMI